VILLDHVVPIRTAPTSTPSAGLPLALQFGDGVGVRRVAIDVDDAWTNVGATAQCHLQKQLGCDCVTLGRQQEIDGVARAESTARYK
jgi:hypothetical protein